MATDTPAQTAALHQSPASALGTERPIEIPRKHPEEVLVGHGTFQLLVLVCAHISAAALAFHHLSIRLLAPSVDHWCKPPSPYVELPVEVWKNTSIPLDSADDYSKCTMYDPPFAASPTSNGTRDVVRCVLWDHSLPTGVQTIESQWNLVCDRAWYVPFSTLYDVLGGFLVMPLLAQVSDKKGRRNVIFVCVAGAILACFPVIFAETFASFVMARMSLAATLNVVSMSTFVLLFEVSAPGYRDLYCCVAQFGAVVGSTTVAVLENFVLDKNVIGLIGMLPTSMLVFSFYAIEDSPRWLVATLNYRGAKRVLLWAAELENAYLDVSALQQVFKKRAEELINKPHAADITFLDVFTKDILRGRTIALCCMWFCLLFSLYGMWHISPKAPGLLIVLLVTVPRAATVPLSYALLKLYTRKAALGAAFPLACGLTCLLTIPVALQKDIGTILHELTLSSILLVMFVVYTYSLELFPTVMRLTGLCAASFCGRVGTTLSPFLTDLSQRTHPSVPHVLIAASMISARGCLRWLPETKHARLPDTLFQLETSMLANVVRSSGVDQEFRN